VIANIPVASAYLRATALMYGADGDPMIPPYPSFSIRITAMWAGGPAARLAMGEGWPWTGSVALGVALLLPHAASRTIATA